MSSTPPPALYPWPSSVRPSQRPPTDFTWHHYLGVPPTAGTVVKASWAVPSSPLPGWEHLSLRQASSSSQPFTRWTHPSRFNMHEQPACHQSSVQVDADWAMSTGRRQGAFSPAQAKHFDPRHGSSRPALGSPEPAPELVVAPPSPALSSPQQEQLAQPVPREVSATGSVQWWKQFPAASAGPSRPEPTRITIESYREARDANVGTPTGLVSSYAHHASGALPAEQSPTEYPCCPYSHRSSACRPPGSAPDHATGSHGFAAGSMVPAGSPSATAHRAVHAYVPRYPEEGYTAPRYPPMAYTNTMSTSTIDYTSTHDHGDVDLTSSLQHHHRGGQVEYDTFHHGSSTVGAPMPMATTPRAPIMETEMPTPSHHHYPYPPSSSRMLTSTHRWHSHEQAASYEDQPPPYTDYSQRGSSLSRRPSLGAIHFETRRASTSADENPFYWQGQLDRQVPYYRRD